MNHSEAFAFVDQYAAGDFSTVQQDAFIRYFQKASPRAASNLLLRLWRGLEKHAGQLPEADPREVQRIARKLMERQAGIETLVARSLRRDQLIRQTWISLVAAAGGIVCSIINWLTQ